MGWRISTFRVQARDPRHDPCYGKMCQAGKLFYDYIESVFCFFPQSGLWFGAGGEDQSAPSRSRRSAGVQARRWLPVEFEAVPLCKRFGISEAHPAIRAWCRQRKLTNSCRREERAGAQTFERASKPRGQNGRPPAPKGKIMQSRGAGRRPFLFGYGAGGSPAQIRLRPRRVASSPARAPPFSPAPCRAARRRPASSSAVRVSPASSSRFGSATNRQ
jgi:hypothetical protein